MRKEGRKKSRNGLSAPGKKAGIRSSRIQGCDDALDGNEQACRRPAELCRRHEAMYPARIAARPRHNDRVSLISRHFKRGQVSGRFFFLLVRVATAQHIGQFHHVLAQLSVQRFSLLRVVVTEIKLREEHSRAGKQLSAQKADPAGWDIAQCGRGTEDSRTRGGGECL